MIAQADQKFDVILADPPWSWDFWNIKTTSRRGAGVFHYPVMSNEEIIAMPIERIAEENCVLFLWTTWPKLFIAIDVIKGWGFRYATIGFLWVKAKRSGFGFHFGMGKYTRRNTEPCLFGVRGSMPPTDRGVSELIYSPVREHSRKPDEQYRKIERLYPEARKLELFARRKQPDWSVWGNEVESDIQLIAQAATIS